MVDPRREVTHVLALDWHEGSQTVESGAEHDDEDQYRLATPTTEAQHRHRCPSQPSLAPGVRPGACFTGQPRPELHCRRPFDGREPRIRDRECKSSHRAPWWHLEGASSGSPNIRRSGHLAAMQSECSASTRRSAGSTRVDERGARTTGAPVRWRPAHRPCTCR